MSSSPLREDLIHLSPAGSGLSPKLLESPGGFIWWYLDLVDEAGNGLVVIWSFGLPFLPGYASAARRGEAPPAGARPSLNVSVYREGVLDVYLLQEFTGDEVVWDVHDQGDTWAYGDSRLKSLVEEGRRKVELDLRLEIPTLGHPLRILAEAEGPGVVSAEGLHRPHHRLEDPLPAHDWTPLLCASQGRLILETPAGQEMFTGRAYHDRNGGRLPLHDLGIDSWIWGRVARGEEEFIYYILDGKEGQKESLFLAVKPDGTMEALPCTMRRGKMRRNLGGLRWWPTLHVEREGEHFLTIEHKHVVDSGPFYLRAVLTARGRDGEVFRGIAEVCEPDRIDLARHRPLVKMRVHHRGEVNSMWLPLFTGPRDGRVARLIKSILPGGGA